MKNLDAYLSTAGIAQKDFARLVDVDPTIISKLRRGLAKPSLDLAVKIWRATDGSVPPQVWTEAAGALQVHEGQ